MSRIIKQIGYNLLLIAISAGVIYITECFKAKAIVGFEKCFNSEFLFVMITALLTVVFWRSLEGIAVDGILNYFGTLVCGFCFFIYGVAITVSESYMYKIVVGGFFLISVAYVVENVIVISHYAKHGQDDKTNSSVTNNEAH